MINKCLLAFIAFLMLVLLPDWGFAQGDMTTLARDTHIFRRLFHNRGCTPTVDFRELENNPRETVLVILGDMTILRSIEITEWVRQGGSLLLATDRGLIQDHPLGFGLRLYGGPACYVRLAEGPGTYRGLETPFVVPTHDGPALFNAGLDTLNRVATNRSGYLVERNPHLPVIARFPPSAMVTRRYGNSLELAFAMAGELGPGRALVMADHSVFINAMLWQTDNQNLDFAFNCVDWLTEKGRRKHVFFNDEGIPQESFDIPLKEIPVPPLPPPEALVGAFNQVMAGLERENRFNELIYHLSNGTISKERAAALAIISLSFMMGLLGLQRLSAAKHRREHGTVPLTASVANLELGRPIHELRSEALSERGNYWEAAHELAIDIFEPLLATHAPGGRLQVASAGSFWQNRRWRRQVQDLWRLAVDPRPRSWTRRQWLRLLGLDQRLRGEIALGGISCVPAAPVIDAASQAAMPRLHSAR